MNVQRAEMNDPNPPSVHPVTVQLAENMPEATGSATGFANTPGRLQCSLDKIARRFPLPAEAVDRVDLDAVRSLVALIKQSPSNADVIQLAKQLPLGTLDCIFPALAISGPDAIELTPRILDRLLLILRERACHTLYNKAWVIWQRHYPHPQLTRALAVVCGILEIKQAGTPPAEASPSPRFPASTFASKLTAPTGRIPLITGLVELTGHAISRKLIAHLEHHPLSLSQFFDRYQVDPEQAFGRSVLYEAFTTGTAAMFSEQVNQFESIFSAADIDARAKIMRHFLTLDPLSDDIRQHAHVVIYRSVGAPSDRATVWTQISERERRVFGGWAFRARIGSHCLGHPEKAKFYLRYADQLQRAESCDDHTLLLYFHHFVIADDAQYPDQALFYAGSVPSPHPTGLANPDHALSPGNPAIAHRRIEVVLREGQISGIIQLLFDSEGLKQSGVLIDFALQSKSSQGFFAPLRNLGRH